MSVYAISDLHVHQDNQPFLFTSEKEKIFEKLAHEILGSDSELFIAGDFIDFTGMENPRKGHLRFFEELFSGEQLEHPAIKGALQEEEKTTQLTNIGLRFPGLFRELGALARAGKLTILPGNHDCYFRDADLQKAFANILGIAEGSIRWKNHARVGEVVFATHGNQFDPANETNRKCSNPGMAITSALYKALMPALTVFGVEENVVHAIPAVRPEELVMHGIEQYLGPENARRLVAAFVGLIAKNGYFPWWKKALLLPLGFPVPIITKHLRSGLTPENLIRALPDDIFIKDHVREEAEKLQKGLNPPGNVVVLGHTHELDHSDHYLNLGTWIDHLTGISLDHLETSDTSLPVLKADLDGNCRVFDARGLATAPRITECREIYSVKGKTFGNDDGRRN